VAEVQKDIDIELAAIENLDTELMIFENQMSPERKEEIADERKYHHGRLYFFSFAKIAAETADENDRLIALGRKYEAEHGRE
jgi:hypothetical protein